MTASRYDLLPPNATTLERDTSRVTSSLQRVGPPVPIIRTAKRVEIPDSVVPWLIYEYGLGEILPFIGDNQRQALETGVQWQRIRGTPAAVEVALGWIGISGVIEEPEAGTDRWAEYMLGLTEATHGDAIIDRIVGAAQVSSPVRSRLQRIYAVYDFRRFVLDDSLLSDGGLLSDHSGVRPRPDWPQISYGENHSALIESDATVQSALTMVVPVLAHNQDRFILSSSIVDDEWHTLNLPCVITETIGLSALYQQQSWGAFPWLEMTWGEPNALVFTKVTTESIDGQYRVAGLHLDGDLVDAKGGTFVGTGVSFTTTDKKFGSAAAIVGGIRSTTLYNFGTGDFTIRAWVRRPTIPGGNFLAGKYINETNHYGIFLSNDGVVRLRRHRPGESFEQVTIGTMSADQFSFIEFGRISGVLRGSVDGVASANTISYPDDLGTTWIDFGFYSLLTIDDAELLIGRPPRTADFSPPSAPFI